MFDLGDGKKGTQRQHDVAFLYLSIKRSLRLLHLNPERCISLVFQAFIPTAPGDYQQLSHILPIEILMHDVISPSLFNLVESCIGAVCLAGVKPATTAPFQKVVLVQFQSRSDATSR